MMRRIPKYNPYKKCLVDLESVYLSVDFKDNGINIGARDWIRNKSSFF